MTVLNVKAIRKFMFNNGLMTLPLHEEVVITAADVEAAERIKATVFVANQTFWSNRDSLFYNQFGCSVFKYIAYVLASDKNWDEQDCVNLAFTLLALM